VLEELNEGLEFIVVCGLEPFELLQELDDLIKVQVRLVQNFIDLILVP
jgi:hypothetical protein